MAQAQPPQPHGHPQMRPPQIGPFSKDKKHSDVERWICIYPAYLNSNKTKAEGRLVPKSKGVANPTFMEIRDVLLSGGFKVFGESKKYPREKSLELEFRGRLRVQLLNDDGTPINPIFATRKSIFNYIVDTIPQLKSRQQKPSQEVVQETTRKKSKKK